MMMLKSDVVSSLVVLISCVAVVAASSYSDWNILGKSSISLRNYCESWRMNVELHNIREFEVVPEECVSYIGKYLTSTQYRVDSERTIEECILYLTTLNTLVIDHASKLADAWIFDIDDTLLSTLPYLKKHQYGGEKLNRTCLEEWMMKAKAPALEHSLNLFNQVKARGIQIILVSSRREHLRSATIDNLVAVGFHGWTTLILRGPQDELKGVQNYKADVRKKLIQDCGYRIWGILADQFTSIQGLPNANRTFKLPNPAYYIY